MFFCGLYLQNNWRAYIVNVKRHLYMACICLLLLLVAVCFLSFLLRFHWISFSVFIQYIVYIWRVYKLHAMQCEWLNCWTEPPIRSISDTHSTESIHINGRLEKCERRPTHKTDIFAVLCTQLLFRLRQQQQSVSTTARHFQNTYSYIYRDRDGRETANNAVNSVIIMFWVGE